MKCAYAKELIALYVENDLDAAQQRNVREHLERCPDCEAFCEQLRQTQGAFKSLRLETPDAAALAGLRRNVLTQMDTAEQSLGWAIRLERFVLLSLRRPIYAAAAIALFALVSASVLGFSLQTRSAAATPAAVFVGNELVRPEGYREWVFVGSSVGLSYAANASQNSGDMFHNVYIDPAAYREYSRTGKFPDGTVMILEMFSSETKKEPGLQGSYEKDFMALEASVKDSGRFAGGWAYFGFTDRGGKLLDRAEAFPDSAGCRTCHEQRAEKDHVFTQFYPVLRSVGAIMTP